jgi:hypothetical protein
VVLVTALAVLGAAASVAEAAASAPDARAALARKEGRWWTYYVPTRRWVARESVGGIDVSSPTGVLYFGQGFGATPGPVTHEEVVELALREDGLDVHPLRRVRISGGSRPRQVGPAVRRSYSWTGVRTNRRERVRGVLDVDIHSDDATFTYGYAMHNRAAPVGLWRRWSGRLKTYERLLLYKPQSPLTGYE